MSERKHAALEISPDICDRIRDRLEKSISEITLRNELTIFDFFHDDD